MPSRIRVILLAVAVGLVLADSSVVTLALPDILEEFDSTPDAVSWVLISFNLVLAVAAVPAARAALGPRAGTVAVGGLLVFAAASLACAVAPSLGVLIAARCVQGLGGAAVVSAALDLVIGAAGSRGRGVAIWTAAGAIGAAVGPAVGGALTDALSWESIFIVQVPLALVCIPAALRAQAALEAESGAARRPALVPLAGLGLLSGGLAGALFLLVLLLVEGWQLSPLAAALVVSVMPASALVAGATAQRVEVRARATVAAVLVGGGLAALGLLPAAEVAWTIAPQLLIGIGLGLGLSALTDASLAGRRPIGLHGGWTIAARHAGIVVALAAVTPVFTADLDQQAQRAEVAGTALVLDAPISPDTKFALALGLAEQVREAGRQLPDIAPAFEARQPSPSERPAFRRLRERLGEELDKAATAAFSTSFLIAAALGLATLVPLAAARDLRPRALLAGAVVTVPLIVVHLAAGGASYAPARPADPCQERPERPQGERFQTLERIFLEALDAAACELGISRERLLLGLAGARELPEGVDRQERNDAVRAALLSAIEQARDEGRLSELEAFALSQAVNLLPIDALLERFVPSGGGS